MSRLVFQRMMGTQNTGAAKRKIQTVGRDRVCLEILEHGIVLILTQRVLKIFDSCSGMYRKEDIHKQMIKLYFKSCVLTHLYIL